MEVESTNFSRQQANEIRPIGVKSASISNINEAMIFERNVEEQIHFLNPTNSASGNNSTTAFHNSDNNNSTSAIDDDTNANYFSNALLRSRQNSFTSLSSRKYNTTSNNNSNLSLTAINTDNSMPSLSSSLAFHTTNANVNSTHHRHLENFIAPVLDASCSIVNDENTDLADVDIVFSKRTSSTLGLDLALGRSITYSTSPTNSTSSPISLITDTQNNQNIHNNLSRSYSYSVQTHNTSTSSLIETLEFGKVLKFYSYADVISDELKDSQISNSTNNTISHSENKQLVAPSNGGNIYSIPSLNTCLSTSSNFQKLPSRNLSAPFIMNRGSATPMFQHQNKKHPNSILSRSSN